jgi:hypothetical protein
VEGAFKESPATGGRPQTLAKEYDTRGHPFAPTEFLRQPSTLETLKPQGHCVLRYRLPRRRMPMVGHAHRRLSTTACPQMSRMNVDHRPAIHSPHRYQPRATGFRRPRHLFRRSQPDEPPRDWPCGSIYRWISAEEILKIWSQHINKNRVR